MGLGGRELWGPMGKNLKSVKQKMKKKKDETGVPGKRSWVLKKCSP